MIRTVDTDVVILCLGKFHDFAASYPDFQLWIKFGSGSSQQMIHINSVYSTIGQTTARGLPFFHALTGCDTTSSFKGKGKKTAWQTWKGYQAISPIFESLSQNPFADLSIDSPMFHQIQKFVMRMYSKNLETGNVNEGQKLLFGLNQNLEKIPPTEDALLQHVKRSVFQTGR